MEIGGSAVQVRLKANPGHGVIGPNGAVKIEGGIDVVAVFHVQPDPPLSEGLYERLADRATLGFQVQDALVSGASRPYSPEAKRGMPSIDSQTSRSFPRRIRALFRVEAQPFRHMPQQLPSQGSQTHSETTFT